MSEYKLKNCPFCGTANVFLQYQGSRYGYMVFCKCDLCGAQAKVFNCKDNPENSDWNNLACVRAIEHWNMRA